MRVAGEAIARQAGIENGDLAAGTAELQGGGEAGKAAADDDDVIHGDGLRVVDGGGWDGPGVQYRPAIRARDGQRAGLRHRRESRPADLERHFHCVVDRRVPPSPNGMEASKGARAISVKPAAVRMRATRPRSPNENGPGASGSGGAVGGTMPLIASIGRRTQSFSAMLRQQTKATRAPGLSARRIWANAPVGSSKNITPKRENRMSNAPSGSSALLASATWNRTGVSGGASARARPISGSDMSMPSTWPPAPTRAARAKLDAPAPQPTSSTRSPVMGAAASIAAWPNTASMASSRAWLATQCSPLRPFQSAT